MSRYSVSRKTAKRYIVECPACFSNIETTHAQNKKYCNMKCQHIHKWNSITVPEILSGSGSEYTCKIYLIKTRGEFCEVCKHPNIWNDKRLVLQLDHVDGNSDNNHLINLRLICPNCHSQTDSFGGANKGFGRGARQMARLQKRNAGMV